MTLSYWFTLAPAPVGGVFGNTLFIIFVLLFACGIAARIIASNKTDDRYMREIGERIATMLVTIGIIGALIYFFSYEQIRLFGARFMYLFLAVVFIVWIILLANFAFKIVPAQRAHEALRQEERKYFPSRRKK